MPDCSRWNGELLALCGAREPAWLVLDEASFEAARWLAFVVRHPALVPKAEGNDLWGRFAALASYARITGQLLQ